MRTEGTPPSPDRIKAFENEILRKYWTRNIILMGTLLLVWALVGLGCGVIWADTLNQWKLPGTGYPMGFWFAQQGSILTFVFLILIYALCMNRLDRIHHAEREELLEGEPSTGESYSGEGI